MKALIYLLIMLLAAPPGLLFGQPKTKPSRELEQKTLIAVEGGYEYLKRKMDECRASGKSAVDCANQLWGQTAVYYQGKADAKVKDFARALKDSYQFDAQRTWEWMKIKGVTIRQMAPVMCTVYMVTGLTAATILSVGFAPPIATLVWIELIGPIKERCGLTAEQAASFMKSKEASVIAIVKVLTEVFRLDAMNIVRILKNISLSDATSITQALKNAGFSARDTAKALKDIGTGRSRIIQLLIDVFRTGAREAQDIVSSIF
jgi:hypothetical protein